MDSLTVIISSPGHSPHKFSLSLGRECSILELKEIITSRLDTNPGIADQRLIYGGRILDDKDTLDQVFEKVDCSDSAPTIHLVVSQRQHTSTPPSPSPLRFRFTPESTAPPAASATSTTAATTGTALNTRNTITAFTASTATEQDRTGSNTTTTGTSTMTPSANDATSAPFPATGMGMAPAFAPFAAAQSPVQYQPLQYVFVNGMPYLVPAAYLPMLQHQHCMQQAHQFSTPHPYFGAVMMNPDGTPYFQHIPTVMMGAAGIGAGAQQGNTAAAGPGVAGAVDGNAQDNAARDQRRAASLWLLMKLAFGVYLFSQNGSIERIVLLHIAALIIFLHQTGRLRIVRRIGHPPGDTPQDGAPNAGGRQQNPAGPAAAQTQQTTTTTTTTTFTSSDNNNNTSDENRQESSSSSSNITTMNSSGNSSNGSNNTQSAQEQSHLTGAGAIPSADGQGAQSAQTQEGASQQQQQQQQQPRLSTWRSIEHALLTFVTSLVPAPPPEIDPAVANAAAAGERGM
ncbi:hypothetical protein BC939DRAFT_506389 [Gamsiella multidivaricata]|uniref:uncharacterized protein n=1 Tax=Gamsiella multidivaricata TaxID=101098 RepID=UPI00221F5C32|nr:uncharacterized protein BC939DRAFT_506389 [Gamsiella multidivaricata]KAG0353279.1 hypothetical protein BGZ54_002308 [Gamsiella multidivaricata]KAI7818644.1 hypothetical protein BC939DRAFT_506389 [Gamsiella multidivaricata]